MCQLRMSCLVQQLFGCSSQARQIRCRYVQERVGALIRALRVPPICVQTRLANAQLRFLYADGSVDTLDLVPPFNFWALSPWGNSDYDYATDAFCLPPVPPPQVQVKFTVVLSGRVWCWEVDALQSPRTFLCSSEIITAPWFMATHFRVEALLLRWSSRS